jgi:hypothetical protein
MLGLLIFLLQIPFIIFLWRLFNSAGEKGWYSLIPIYNLIILLKIVRLKWIFVFIYFLPTIFVFVNQELSFVSSLASVFFTMILVYRALVCIGKKPHHFMEFLLEVTILSPIIFLVLSTDNLNYDPLRLKQKSL